MQDPTATPDADSAASAPSASIVRGLRWRWLGLTALLLCEYMWISFRFDVLPLLRSSGMLGALGWFGIATPLAVVAAAATFVLAGRNVRRDALVLVVQHRKSLRSLPFVLLNLGSYYALVALTEAVLARPFDAPAPGSWIAGWIALLSVTVLALIPAAVPLPALVPLVYRNAKLGALGLGLGVFAWFAGLASTQMWMQLRVSTVATVYFLLSVVGADIVYIPDDDIIGTQDFYVIVAPECSGVEGIGFILAFTLIYLWSARERLIFPRAFGLLPLAVAAVWVGNALRILALIGVGTFISPEIAFSGFHSKAGWLFFSAVALGIIALAQRSTYFTGQARASSARDDGPTWNPTATHVAPLLALISTSLITGLFSTGFDHAYALRVLATGTVIYLYRTHLPKPEWPASWHAPVIGIAVFIAWILLIPHPSPDDVEAFRDTLSDMPSLERVSWLAFRVLGSTLTVPIAEELAFRGFLLRRLMSTDFVDVPKTQLTPLAVLVSSLAFGSLHNQAWIAGTVAGVAYAFAQRARGRTADAIIAHGITNGLIAINVLAFDADWLWA